MKKIKENSQEFINETLKYSNDITNSLTNRCDNKELCYLVYKLIKRIERLEEKIKALENSNASTFLAFVKKWFFTKRIC